VQKYNVQHSPNGTQILNSEHKPNPFPTLLSY